MYDFIFFERYREIGFNKASEYTKEIAIELNIDLPQRRIIRRKIQFDGNLNTPSVEVYEEESFRIYYFLYLLDQAIVSLKKRFEQYQQYKNIFDIIFLSIDSLKFILGVLHFFSFTFL